MDWEFLIPIVFFIIFGSIPIIRMLIGHQQKMAELLHRGTPEANAELARLNDQVNRLSSIVHQNAIEIDTLKQQLAVTNRAPDASIEHRIGQ